MIYTDPERGDLPDGAIVNCEIVITSYVDMEGHLKYATNVAGDPNLAQALGLCELAKHSIYKTYMMTEPFPPDSNDDEEDEEDDDEEGMF
jgi:hypothetical protein